MLTYVACACASLLSSSAANPLTWLNVLLSASRSCCHCAGEQKNLDVGKLVKLFFYLIKLDTNRKDVFFLNCGLGVLTSLAVVTAAMLMAAVSGANRSCWRAESSASCQWSQIKLINA